MEQYTLLTNISCADFKGCRLWCHGILIDNLPRDGIGEMTLRQIRGLTWGGLPAFTIWISPDAEVKLKDKEGGNLVMLSQDGNSYNLDAGVIISVNDEDILTTMREDMDKPVEVCQLNYTPFGDSFDNRILQYARGSNYPNVMWVRLPDKAEIRRRMATIQAAEKAREGGDE